MFATHPPIEERLRRIYGRNVSVLDAPELASGYATESETLPDIPYVTAGIADAASQAPWIAFGNSAGAAQSTTLAPELDSAVREPQAACAVVYALLLGGAERDTQLAVLNSDALAQAALAPVLARAIERMPKSARLPLLDMAMPALKQLSYTARTTLLAVADRLIAADKKMSLAEFVLQTVLVRRLDPRAGRATPVRFTQLEQLRADCITLLSLVAHAAAPGANRTVSDLFANGAERSPELGLSAAELADVAVIDFQNVKAALDRVHQLAPLAKPAFIKAVLAASGDTEPMPVATADLLRAICAAIDAPVPSAVAATYAAYHWQF
jgi:hypothetical protein